MAKTKFGRAIVAVLLLALTLGGPVPASAADTKISAMTSASPLAGPEQFPAVQSAANVRVTATQIKTFAQTGLATIATSGSAADLTSGTLPAGRLPALTGDVASSAGSATTAIGANRVTRGMLAQTAGATVLGATGAGNVADLTATQAKSFLAIAAPDVAPKGISAQAGTSYTAVLADKDLYTRFTSGSAVAFTIPPNSSVAFPLGTEIELEQAGAGVVTVTAGGGVTINSRGAVVATAGQYAVATLKKVATDTWTLTGDLQ